MLFNRPALIATVLLSVHAGLVSQSIAQQTPARISLSQFVATTLKDMGLPDSTKIAGLSDARSLILEDVRQGTQGASTAKVSIKNIAFDVIRYIPAGKLKPVFIFGATTTPPASSSSCDVVAGTLTRPPMENKGHLRRLRTERYRRAVRLELTPAGRALLKRDPLLVVDDAVAGLPAGEKEAITDGLDRLLRDVQQRLGANDFGVCETCSLFAAEDAAGEHDGPHRCGLTLEPISRGEAQLICVNHLSAAE